MAQSLEGKVALVTGASSGIGEDAALAPARAGATVATYATSKFGLTGFSEALRREGDDRRRADALRPA